MYLFKFTVDKELKLLSMDGSLKKIYNRFVDSSSSLPYFEVLPKITMGNADAIDQVIHDGKPLSLKDYKVNCLCGLSMADISIIPIVNKEKEIIGAEATIAIHPECILSNAIKESQILADIGKTSAGLAHGVRSPLNAIKGSIIYLQGRYSDDPVFLEFSQIIEGEINKLDKFITKFLSRSLPDKETQDIDVNALLGEILKMLSLQALSKKISLCGDFTDIPKIKAEPFQFKHAILNIINNSIEATQDGGSINLKTFLSLVDHKNHVTIQITDSGIGLSNIDLSQSLKEESAKKGKGYGLFLTHEIVRNLGGFLEIRSEKSVGTTVNINIPV